MWGNIAIAFLLAFITSFVIVPYTIKWSRKIDAVDKPNERKINKMPIPRIGGIAVITGFFVSSLFLIITMSIQGELNLAGPENYKRQLLGFFLGSIVLGGFALCDDIYTLKPLVKLAGQLIAAIIVFVFGIRIDEIGRFILPIWASAIITIGWIVGLTNAINLIDGLDGLSSGISLISCLSLLMIFATNYSPAIAIILVTALAGGIVGFMPYNIYPARTFIGDVGAQFLGFALAIIAILGVAKTVTLVVLIAPVLVLGLPIFDTLFAIVRRLVKGKSIKAVFQADRGHLHHRLMQQGFTQKQAVMILYAASATLGMFAIILINETWQKAVAFIGVVLIVLLIGLREVNNYKKKLISENKEKGLVDTEEIDTKNNDKE